MIGRVVPSPASHVASSYRQPFVEACLDASPPRARTWLAELESTVEASVRPTAAETDQEAVYPRRSLNALAQIGAMGVNIPVEYGGLGFGDAMTALMVETVARGCASTGAVVMFHAQVARRLVQFGGSARREMELPRLASGEWIGASAWSELLAGADKAALGTQLHGGPGEWRISGGKDFCTGLAEHTLVHVLLSAPAAVGASGSTFVSVRLSDVGVRVDKVYRLMGLRGSATGTIQLEEAPVSDDQIVGAIGDGGTMMQANHEVLLNPGLLSMGVASAAHEDVAEAACGRWSTMRSITQFQNARLALADLDVSLSSVYSLAAQTIRDVAVGRPHPMIRCYRVKVLANQAAIDATVAAAQLAGGRGGAGHWPFERHHRDAVTIALMGPNNEVVREKIADHQISRLEKEHAE